MMATSTPSQRIGDTERAAAQRALQIHLDAGRLQVTEFVERFAGVADAVTAADVAAVFADLPAPHPPLPAPPTARPRRVLVIVAAVAALVLVGMLGFVIGRARPAPAASPGAVAAPGAGVARPTASAGEGPDGLPQDATVRRSTGPGLITLRPSDGVDLDELDGPAWNVSTGCCGHDVVFGADAGRLFITDGHAAVTGPLGFATCLGETTYTDAPIRRGSLQAGETFCVRTNGQRLALVTIIEVSAQAVAFGATVWDPPVPS